MAGAQEERELMEELRKEVRRRLGDRDPIDKAEEAAVKLEIYKSIPGLIDLVLRAERVLKHEAEREARQEFAKSFREGQ